MNHVDVLSSAVPESGSGLLPPPLTSSVLSPRHLAILAAAADRIIPSDNRGPGGALGGSLEYIVRHLEEGGNLAAFGAEYRAFLQALDAAGFIGLDSAAQDAILSRIERSDSASDRRFFRLFAEHAQEGYYTNPENWPSIGFTVTG